MHIIGAVAVAVGGCSMKLWFMLTSGLATSHPIFKSFQSVAGGRDRARDNLVELASSPAECKRREGVRRWPTTACLACLLAPLNHHHQPNKESRSRFWFLRSSFPPFKTRTHQTYLPLAKRNRSDVTIKFNVAVRSSDIQKYHDVSIQICLGNRSTSVVSGRLDIVGFKSSRTGSEDSVGVVPTMTPITMMFDDVE